MANWTDIDVNSLLPGQPFTSSIALAYEENPRAIAEGATGAPRIAEKIVTGSADATITSVDSFGGFWVKAGGSFDKIGGGAGSGTITVSFSTDGGSTFFGATNILSTSVPESSTLSAGVDAWFDFDTGNYAAFRADNNAGSFGTVSGASLGIDAVRIAFTANTLVTSRSFLFRFTGGGF